MVDYSNPFLTSFLGSRNQFTQPQNQFNQQQNQYDFSGWGDRLNKIEEGIAGLTNQFNNFQTPGDVAPEYTGNAAPEPLEQSANAPEPLGGIESLAPTQNTGFNFDPSGGSLFSQLSTAYGQPATIGQQFLSDNPDWDPNRGTGMGSSGYTPGFSQFVQDQGYYVDRRPTALDRGPVISETPIPIGLGGRMEGQQVYEGYNDQFNPVNKPTSQPGRPNPLLQGEQLAGTWSPPAPGWRPNQGTPPPQQALNSGLAGLKPGINGLAAYQQNNKGAGI